MFATILLIFNTAFFCAVLVQRTRLVNACLNISMKRLGPVIKTESSPCSTKPGSKPFFSSLIAVIENTISYEQFQKKHIA